MPQHYHFVSADEFERMIAAGDFFEHALVHGDYKGTARQSVEPQLAAGQDVLLEIDWQGARQVRSADARCGQRVHPAAVARGAASSACATAAQDSEAVIAQRLAAAREEMSHYGEFDYVIVNEDFDTAVDEMRAIFTGQPPAAARRRSRAMPRLIAALAGAESSCVRQSRSATVIAPPELR